MTTKRRWTMEVQTEEGAVEYLVLEVPKGQGRVHTWRKGRGSLTLHPRQVSKLCRILNEAMAQAVQDADRW